MDNFITQPGCFSYWDDFVTFLPNWMKFELKQTEKLKIAFEYQNESSDC